MKIMLIALTLSLGLSNVFASGSGHKNHKKVKFHRVLHIVNHQFEGTKQWLPGTLMVKPGEKVQLKLTNKTPSGIHGFRLWDANHKNALITTTVPKGKTVETQFTAGKKGEIYQFDCQLNPCWWTGYRSLDDRFLEKRFF